MTPKQLSKLTMPFIREPDLEQVLEADRLARLAVRSI